MDAQQRHYKNVLDGETMTFERNQRVITPDGYCAQVLLCGHPEYVLVYLRCTHEQGMTQEKRHKTYRKDAEGWQAL